MFQEAAVMRILVLNPGSSSMKSATYGMPGEERDTGGGDVDAVGVRAVHGGRSIDTSMGFTPMEGLVMGTRGGDLDPGAILYLLRNGATDVDDLLNHRSGLLGLSGISGDVRELEASSDANAQLALDVFAYRAAKYV